MLDEIRAYYDCARCKAKFSVELPHDILISKDTRLIDYSDDMVLIGGPDYDGPQHSEEVSCTLEDNYPICAACNYDLRNKDA